MVRPAAKREGVAHLQAVMGLSERRACSIVGADRKMIRYRSCRAPDTELRTRLRDLANERRRFGYLSADRPLLQWPIGGGCSSYCTGMANRPASTASSGSIEKRA